MTEYKVAINGFNDIPEDRFSNIPAGTEAFIFVKPPFTPGPGLPTILLGQNPDRKINIDIQHVMTTDEVTVFVAQSKRSNNQETRVEDITTMADRLKTVVNQPEEAVTLSQQPVFPKTSMK